MMCADVLPNPRIDFTSDTRNIFLHNVQITSCNTFVRLPYLQLLELNNCSFITQNLRPSLFLGITYLKTLLLTNLDIATIESNTFFDMAELSVLSIHGSVIGMLSANAFNGLKLVTTLNLSTASLSKISTCAFCHMENLMTLNLSRNNLKSLNKNIFAGLQNIKVIDLKQNRIKYIEHNALHIHGADIYFTLPYYCCYTSDTEVCIQINAFHMKAHMCKTIFRTFKFEIANVLAATSSCAINIIALTMQISTTNVKAQSYLARLSLITNIFQSLYGYGLFIVSQIHSKNYIWFET